MFVALIYLLTITVAIYIYLIVLFYFAKAIMQAFKAFFTTKWGCYGCLPVPGDDDVQEPYVKRFREKLNFSFFNLVPRRNLFRFLLLTITLSAALYIYERQQWINEGTVYKDAKEYFVTGQVLAGYRKILSSVIPPDNVALWPLTVLQQSIYDSGTALLPKEDAEDAMWYQMWFIYPYSVRDYVPYGTWEVEHGRDRQQAWLEKVWPRVEKLSHPVFKDKKMREAYIKGFPGLAFYYSLNQIFYYDKDVPKAMPYLRTIPKHIERNEILWEGLIVHQRAWDAAHMDEGFGKKHPKVKVLMQLAMMNVTEFLIQSSIMAHTFRCDMPAVRSYVTARNTLVGPDSERSGPIYALKQREQEPLFNGFINKTSPYFYKYVTKEICHYDVYGIKQKELRIPRHSWTEEQEYTWIKRVYKKQIDYLSQTIKGEASGNGSGNI